MRQLRERFQVGLLVAATTMLAACESEPDILGEGDSAPAFSAVDFAGTGIQFPEIADHKPTVLVVWATWCNYCKAFMPFLGDIAADYGSDINILAINAKEDGSGDPEAYLAGLDFPLIAVRDGDAIAASYDIEYIPGLMVIDADGVIAYRREWTDLPAGETVGRLWSLKVRSHLDALLN